MQRIALGAVTQLATQTGESATVRIAYRKPGLRHIVLAAVGVDPKGVVNIDTTHVQISERSRTRHFTLTMPAAAVRSVGVELSRRLAQLIVGIVLATCGTAVIVFSQVADIRGVAGWWGASQSQLADLTPSRVSQIADTILAVGLGILALALISLAVFAFRREIVLRFDAGSTGGGRLNLRRSWNLPLPFQQTIDTLDLIPQIILEAGHPRAPMTRESDETA